MPCLKAALVAQSRLFVRRALVSALVLCEIANYTLRKVDLIILLDSQGSRENNTLLSPVSGIRILMASTPARASQFLFLLQCAYDNRKYVEGLVTRVSRVYIGCIMQ